MKTRVAIAAAITIAALLGCAPHTSQTADAMMKLERSAFDLGVQCAINARYAHAKAYMERGESPPELGVLEWQERARKIRDNWPTK